MAVKSFWKASLYASCDFAKPHLYTPLLMAGYTHALISSMRDASSAGYLENTTAAREVALTRKRVCAGAHEQVQCFAALRREVVELTVQHADNLCGPQRHFRH